MHELAAHIVWDRDCSSGRGARTCGEACVHVQRLLAALATPAALDASTRPLVDTAADECLPSEGDWGELLARCLGELDDVAGAEAAAADAEGAGAIPRSAIRVRAARVYCTASTRK